MSQVTCNKLIGYNKDDDAQQRQMTGSTNQQEWQVNDYFHKEMWTRHVLEQSTTRYGMLVAYNFPCKPYFKVN